VYDAILLNTTRIGHGYEFRNHPFLIEVVKSKNIAIEMLRISPNIQNHMAVELLNNNVQITISPDDPGLYGYSGVSYDYYEAFISWRLSLKGLKNWFKIQLFLVYYNPKRNKDIWSFGNKNGRSGSPAFTYPFLIRNLSSRCIN